jgi:hypothetical protein
MTVSSIGIQAIMPKTGTPQQQTPPQAANDNAADSAAASNKPAPPPPGMGRHVDKTV